MISTATTPQPSKSEEMLRAFDPDLPFLASQAAIEIDNLILGQPSGAQAIGMLAERLKNSSEKVEGREERRALMDLSTVEVFGSAVSASQVAQVTTLSELALHAWKLADELAAASSASKSGVNLEKMRAFCVALSNSASAYRHSVNEFGQIESPWA